MLWKQREGSSCASLEVTLGRLHREGAFERDLEDKWGELQVET